ncbi:hypothetical protein EVAR_51886_1 [Eumeta japonica]|uniref:Uncharacterized protein n=1 Tax=Eumeta variegata TaxID=151549 RepID=A0A4C1XHR9_EUMVA|nr:hypothetical protein EVAR_51886_1 [Eumeta japonica]
MDIMSHRIYHGFSTLSCLSSHRPRRSSTAPTAPGRHGRLKPPTPRSETKILQAQPRTVLHAPTYATTVRLRGRVAQVALLSAAVRAAHFKRETIIARQMSQRCVVVRGALGPSCSRRGSLDNHCGFVGVISGRERPGGCCGRAPVSGRASA